VRFSESAEGVWGPRGVQLKGSCGTTGACRCSAEAGEPNATTLCFHEQRAHYSLWAIAGAWPGHRWRSQFPCTPVYISIRDPRARAKVGTIPVLYRIERYFVRGSLYSRVNQQGGMKLALPLVGLGSPLFAGFDLTKVRKTPSWPRSSANLSLL
jgi:hypothetical protein